MEILNWLVLAFGTVSGGTTLFTVFMYRKQTKRFKDAEAYEKETNAMKVAIDVLKEQVVFINQQLQETQKQLATRDTENRNLREDRQTLEIKHARNKFAINKAYECENREKCGDKVSACPVLQQRKINEEEYLRSIDKR